MSANLQMILSFPYLIFFSFLLYLVLLRLLHGQKRFAPGPPKWPVVGNALQVPKSYLWLKLSKWARQYGELPTGPTDLIADISN